MSQPDQKKIKEATEEFFKKTGLDIEVEVKPLADSTVPVILKTEDPQLLIGEKGQTLFEIQKLLRSVLRKKTEIEGSFYVDVDINDYKKRKAEYLKELARNAADEVVLDKKEKELHPMSPYERRIVHMELASRTDIVTESIGDGPERRIVIKPSV